MRLLTFFLFLFILLGCSRKGNYVSGLGSFTKMEAKLVFDKASTIPMRVYKINQVNDSLLLRKKSELILFREGDKKAQQLLTHFTNRLLSTVKDSMSLGVGIAAPQVGILKQIIWVQRFDKADFPFEVYVNPQITHYSQDKQDCLEGCLSIPDKRETTKIRAQTIVLDYQKLDGSPHIDTISGFTSVIFQHEVDHLHGILFTDHLDQEIKSSK